MTMMTHGLGVAPPEARFASTATMAPPIRRIVVATTGEPTCRAALRAAHSIAVRHAAHVNVVSVFHPRIPHPAPGGETGDRTLPTSERDPARRQLAAVRQQLTMPGLLADDWSLTFMTGQPAHNINIAAKADHADLVVIGLGREDASERRMGDRGSMAIAAMVGGPLLAVAPNHSGETRDVLLAVGYDASSAANAVRVAQQLFPAPQRLYLVHVAEPGSLVRQALIQRNVDAVRRALGTWDSARVEASVRIGDPIDQLLSFAQEREVSLVVGGLHGRSFDERAILPNAALWLMAIGDRSVLLVPTEGRMT